MRYTFTKLSWLTFSLGRGEEHELRAEITYGFNPGRRATPPAYSHGGLPPEPAEVEILSVVLWDDKDPKDRWPAPGWILDILHGDQELYDTLCEDAGEQIEGGK